METKAQIRTKYIKMREELNPVYSKQWSKKICKHIVKSEVYQNAKIIGVYAALRNEADLKQLVEQAWMDGKKTFFPKVKDQDIYFYEIKDFSMLKEGCFHVMEPCVEEGFYEGDMLVLTPGVVFDAKGNRYGYGKGFYDRYFALHPKDYRMGIAYAMQIEKNLPSESQDIRMHSIVTENGFV